MQVLKKELSKNLYVGKYFQGGFISKLYAYAGAKVPHTIEVTGNVLGKKKTILFKVV